MSFPMPNDKILGGTCIASTWYREGDDKLPNDRYTVVVLMPQAPYYKVCVVEDRDTYLHQEWTEIHKNIVPAINGEPARIKGHTDNFIPSVDGYVDMGGDY